MRSDVAVVVPTKNKEMLVVTDDGQQTMDPQHLLRFFESTNLTILALMGGKGQAQFVRAHRLGRDVRRIPHHRLTRLVGPLAGSGPNIWAAAIDAASEMDPEAFYAVGDIDGDIAEIRQLTRLRLSVQETFRKPADLMFQAAARDLEPVSEDDEAAVALKRFYANSAMIAGAKADEKDLELRIDRLLKRVPIWRYLKPPKGSSLPVVAGLGPSLGGSLIGEIEDIHRFNSSSALRAYARFGLVGGNPDTGELPHFPRRRRGEVSNWNSNLHRAVWLWTSGQITMRESVWREAYYWYKALELEKHPEVEQVLKFRRNGETGEEEPAGTASKFSLGHLDKRARRLVGSLMLEYVYELWTTLDDGKDVEQWYQVSRYPDLFTGFRSDLASGRMAFLESEITRRRAAGEPSEDDSEGSTELTD